MASAAATASSAVATTRSSGNGTPKAPSSSFDEASESVGMAGNLGLERRPEELADGLDAGLERVLGHGVAAEEPVEEVDVAEVVEDRPVAADDELLGVVLAQAARAHLALEVGDGPLEPRPQ